MAWLPQAFVAIIIVVIAAAIAAAVKDLISNALGGLSYGRLLANVASYFIIGLGVIAALNQIGVATTVTTPVLIAVLATIAGVIIVGVGGGLVRPMQSRWEGWLDRAATESQTIAAARQGLPGHPVGGPARHPDRRFRRPSGRHRSSRPVPRRPSRPRPSTTSRRCAPRRRRSRPSRSRPPADTARTADAADPAGPAPGVRSDSDQ